MSEWGWVALAYALTYSALAAYVTSLVLRIRRTREQLEELR
jgi:hypothetical protein